MSLADTEIVVTIDADTEIEPDAIRNLIRHFSDPQVGAGRGQCEGRQTARAGSRAGKRLSTSPARTWRSARSTS